MHDRDTALAELAERLAVFNGERDWGRFHTPRDLAMAVSIEAGELLELFLWKPDAMPDVGRLREELADVLICLVNLAAKVDVDLMAAASDKLAANAAKYPVERARGNAKKWSEFREQRSVASGEQLIITGGDDAEDPAAR